MYRIRTGTKISATYNCDTGVLPSCRLRIIGRERRNNAMKENETYATCICRKPLNVDILLTWNIVYKHKLYYEPKIF